MRVSASGSRTIPRDERIFRAQSSEFFQTGHTDSTSSYHLWISLGSAPAEVESTPKSNHRRNQRNKLNNKTGGECQRTSPGATLVASGALDCSCSQHSCGVMRAILQPREMRIMRRSLPAITFVFCLVDGETLCQRAGCAHQARRQSIHCDEILIAQRHGRKKTGELSQGAPPRQL